MSEASWYVVHTYSGYENKVKANIEKTIENRHLEDQILEVRVPMQDVVELKDGASRSVQKKMFPGYVLINMIMNDDTWYVVRNTRGVTGFVGPGSKPVPLTEEEMRFVFDFGFQSLDKELINSLIEELKSKDRDFENIKKRYNAMIGIRPEWEQKAESLIAALEMYRIQEEKALNSLERILNVCGVNVSRDDIENGNLDEIREKVREHKFEGR